MENLSNFSLYYSDYDDERIVTTETHNNYISNSHRYINHDNYDTEQTIPIKTQNPSDHEPFLHDSESIKKIKLISTSNKVYKTKHGNIAVKEENLNKNNINLDKVREACSLRDHANVIKIYGYCKLVSERIYILMQLADEKTLRDLLTETKNINNLNIPDEMKIIWAKNVSNGLIFLIQNQIIHCDLNAENILFTEYPRNLHEMKRTTLLISNYIKPYGTPTHILPEVLRNRSYDIMNLTWNYVVFLWELFTQNFVLIHHSNQDFIRILKQDFNIVEPVKNLIYVCLDLDGNKRPNLQQISNELGEILKFLSNEARVPDETDEYTFPSANYFSFH